MSTDRGRHALFLDRDGVLNRAVIRGGRPVTPRTSQDLEIPEDAAASLQALRRAGYALVAVSNQPGVSRGTRKPKPGMILDSARSLSLDPAASVMIGDRWSDIEAGRRAGCLTVLIGDGYGELTRGRPRLTHRSTQ